MFVCVCCECLAGSCFPGHCFMFVRVCCECLAGMSFPGRCFMSCDYRDSLAVDELPGALFHVS